MRHVEPYAHWVIDNAISESLIQSINRDWPDDDDSRWRKEDGRFTRKWSMPAKDGAAGRLMTALMRPSFCESLGELIGVSGLQPDYAQFGGGLHAIPQGGFLQMHRDFRHHQDGRRRVANLLLYVNREWQPDWGGALRLAGESSVDYLPFGGRAVIFRTDKKASIHGHPEPLACPSEVMRRSIAVYYYIDQRGTPDTTRYYK